jgi:hypothetical protein
MTWPRATLDSRNAEGVPLWTIAFVSDPPDSPRPQWGPSSGASGQGCVRLLTIAFARASSGEATSLLLATSRALGPP